MRRLRLIRHFGTRRNYNNSMEEVEVVVLFIVFYCFANMIFTSVLERRLVDVEEEIEYAQRARVEKRRRLLCKIMEIDCALTEAEIRRRKLRRRVLQHLRARRVPPSGRVHSRATYRVLGKSTSRLHR